LSKNENAAQALLVPDVQVTGRKIPHQGAVNEPPVGAGIMMKTLVTGMKMTMVMRSELGMSMMTLLLRTK